MAQIRRQWVWGIIIATLIAIVLVVDAVLILNSAVPADDSNKTATSNNTPITKPFSFAAVGDFGMTADTDKVLRKIGESDTNFTLALGDLSYAGNGSEAAWCDFVRQRVGESYPFELLAGNHDDGDGDGNILEYRKCLPDKIGTIVGDYGIEYYFDYGELARFILISPDINNVGFAYTKGMSHYDWVAGAIDDARKDGLRWIVLGMHKNCTSIETKSCEIGEDVLNLAVDKKVDLVLQGHEHTYSRTKQLSLSPECPSIPINTVSQGCIAGEGSDLTKGAGTIIVVDGTGGKEMRPIALDDSEIGYYQTWNGTNVGNSFGFMKFDVSDTQLRGEFVPTSGVYSDSFTISAR
jgi:hypothetical protein